MSGNTPDWVKRAENGMPLVCLYSFDVGQFGNKSISKGNIYLLRELFENATNGEEILVRLEGIILNRANTGREMGFPSCWFRPADTTDLPASIRECLNTPVKGKERENV